MINRLLLLAAFALAFAPLLLDVVWSIASWVIA